VMLVSIDGRSERIHRQARADEGVTERPGAWFVTRANVTVSLGQFRPNSSHSHLGLNGG
jgi:hypothetical protein